MSSSASQPRRAGPRDLFFFSHPDRWPTWPFLPVIRRNEEGELECGVLFDCVGSGGPTGYSSSVFLTNLFTMPSTLVEFFKLPRETFDSPEEMGQAGWVVD